MAQIHIIFPPGWIRLHPIPPLGISVINSTLKNAGYDSKAIDLEIMAYQFNINNNGLGITLEKLTKPEENVSEIISTDISPVLISGINKLIQLSLEEDTEYVIFSIMGPRQFISALHLSKKLKQLGITNIGGGCYISRNYERIKEYNVFDYCFSGYETENLLHLLENIIKHNNESREIVLNEINTTYNIENQPLSTFEPDMMKIYRDAIEKMYKIQNPKNILQYLIDVGCRKRCSFCVRFEEEQYQHKSVDKITTELKILSGKYSVDIFSFVTNAININRKFMADLSMRIVEEQIGIKWYTYAIPDILTKEEIENLFKAGCRLIRYGVETGSEKILKDMNKEFSISKIEEILENSHEVGIFNQVNFVVGYPYENEEDLNDTLHFIEQNHEVIDSIRINPFYIQSDSQLYNNPDKFHITIINQKNGVLGFDEINGVEWKEKSRLTMESINKIYEKMKKYGIGFYGISSNLLMSALNMNKYDIRKTKRWLNDNHPYLLDNMSFEDIRWHIYHSHEFDKKPFNNSWEHLIGLTFNLEDDYE